MFTGIIEEVGKVISLQKSSNNSKIKIEAEKVLKDTRIGDSIAVNGVCLTVVSLGDNYFFADIMDETYRRSNLGDLKKGDLVNLERALTLSSRLGGHIVSGHIDGTGEILSMMKEDIAIWVHVKTPQKLLRYIVEKGSIAIDGISLTVAYVDSESFKVSVIPHTGAETALLHKKVSDIVNLECDVIGKYVEKLVSVNEEMDNKKQSNINKKFLFENGFL